MISIIEEMTTFTAMSPAPKPTFSTTDSFWSCIAPPRMRDPARITRVVGWAHLWRPRPCPILVGPGLCNKYENRDNRYRCLYRIPAVPNPPWFVRARLKTRQLMLMIAIEEQGNIHRAAESLNMSQPAASKLLKDLE